MNTPKYPTSSVIEDLWHGRIDPHAVEQYQSPAFRRMLREESQIHADLMDSLNEKQKLLLLRLEDYTGEHDALSETAVFCLGFKLGARMMLEILTEEKESCPQ